MARRYIILTLGSVLLCAYLYRIDWIEFQTRVLNFRHDYIVAIVLLNLVPGVVKSIRWRYFLGKSNVATPLVGDYLSVNAAFFLGLVTPGTAGEMSRVLNMENDSRKGVSILIFEKLTDLGVLFVLVIVTGILQMKSAANKYIAMGIFFSLIAAAHHLFLRYDRLFTGPMKGLLEKFFKEGRIRDVQLAYWDCYSLIGNRTYVLQSIVFSLVLWVLPLLQVHFICLGLGLEISWLNISFMYFLPYLASVVSLVPLGLGVFDLGLQEMGGAFGIVPAAGFIPVFYRVFVTVPLILFGYACQVLLTIRGGAAKIPRTIDTK